MVDAELEVHCTARDFDRVLHRLRVVGEQGGHLLGGFDQLAGLHPQAVGIVHRLAHLDAHEGVLHLRVLPAEIVGVVGHHQGMPVSWWMRMSPWLMAGSLGSL